MEGQITNNPYALPLFFTEEVFVIDDNSNQSVESGQRNENKVDTELAVNDNSVSYKQEANQKLEFNEPETNAAFDFLGKNEKQILILVNDEINEVSTEGGNVLLKKILKAVNIGKDDFALVNIAKQSISHFSLLNTFFKPKVLIAFGVDETKLGLGKNETGRLKANGAINIVSSINLAQLDTDASAKKLLWEDLKSCKF